mgnify:FL=1
MSIFSNSVKSQIIDPVFASNQRIEFRLANRGESYMPTMRIGNLGLKKTSVKQNMYHFGPGAASVITRMQLLDGNEELDSLRRVGNWLTFKNSLHTNSQNDNVFGKMVGGKIGWSTGATGELLHANPKLVRDGSADTLGTLDLREVFPILNSVSHLSTKLFPNLRVVLEYTTDNRALVNNQTADRVTGLERFVPILIVDEIVDDALAASLDAQFQSASWVAVESDESAVPQVPTITAASAVGAEAVQSVNLRINGFQNKAVSRVMISKVYQDLANYIYVPESEVGETAIRAIGQYGSKALHKEEFNLRVNGRNVLAGRGVTSPAANTMLLSDTWGDLNICPGANVESVGLDSKYSLTATTTGGVANVPVNQPCKNWSGSNETSPRILYFGGVLDAAGTAWTTQPTAQQGPWVGNSSWIGVGVHDRVSDMQIQLTRTGNATSGAAGDAPTSSAGNYQALNILVFAEIAKRIDVSGGQYKISYA